MQDYHDDSIRNLLRVIAALNTEEECKAFFDDLCTIRELQDMSQRLETAVLLAEGNSYQQIASQVGISTATISRVNRCLQYGAGGYANAIRRLKGETPRQD